MTDTQAGIIALVKSALTGNGTIPTYELNWDEITDISRKHQIFSMVYYGAFSSHTEIPKKKLAVLESYVYKGLSVDQNQNFALKAIEKEFTENKIDYMPLKGSWLKFVYPKTDMRTMGDIDILIREEQYEKIIPIMKKLGYTFKAETSHDLEWNGRLAHIELHKSLIPPQNTDFYGYFGSGWKKAIQSPENPFCYTLSDEEQLIYLFTHFVKHYRSAGIGIRHITDIWVFRSAHPGIDEKQVLKALKIMGLDAFYRNVSATLENWFENKPATEMTDYITDYIFESGAYGINKNRLIFNEAIKDTDGDAGRTKIKYILKTAFPPLSAMRLAYPVLKRCPFLLPFVWVVRWFKGLLFKSYRIKQGFENLSSLNSADIDEQKKALQFVGLKSEFKE